MELIDAALLEEVAKMLKVPAEAIKNFDEEAVVNIISNTFNDDAVGMLKTINVISIPLIKLLSRQRKLNHCRLHC